MESQLIHPTQYVRGWTLKKNGRHSIDKIGNAVVSAQVSYGKVVGMTAFDVRKGPLPVHKMMSPQKLTGFTPTRVGSAKYGDNYTLINYPGAHYAWCFENGIETWCYWFSANTVMIDSGWPN